MEQLLRKLFSKVDTLGRNHLQLPLSTCCWNISVRKLKQQSHNNHRAMANFHPGLYRLVNKTIVTYRHFVSSKFIRPTVFAIVHHAVLNLLPNGWWNHEDGKYIYSLAQYISYSTRAQSITHEKNLNNSLILNNNHISLWICNIDQDKHKRFPCSSKVHKWQIWRDFIHVKAIKNKRKVNKPA